MSEIEVYHGVFGEWHWECLDERGSVLDESRQGFATLEECLDDARRQGYLQGGGLEREVARPRSTLATTVDRERARRRLVANHG